MGDTKMEQQRAANKAEQQKKRRQVMRQRLIERGFSDAEIKRAMDPIESFHVQLEEEISGK